MCLKMFPLPPSCIILAPKLNLPFTVSDSLGPSFTATTPQKTYRHSQWIYHSTFLTHVLEIFILKPKSFMKRSYMSSFWIPKSILRKGKLIQTCYQRFFHIWLTMFMNSTCKIASFLACCFFVLHLLCSFFFICSNKRISNPISMLLAVWCQLTSCRRE